MDVDRLRRGELIAGVSGVALLLIMFIFDWYGIKDAPGGGNAWESYGFIDIVLFVTVVVAVGLAVATASSQSVSLPVAASALTAGLGILSVILVLYRIINPPDFDLGGLAELADVDLDVTRKIGVFLGLIAAGGVAYGGWQSMQEEGTTFAGEADRLQDRVGGPDEPGAPPPPPAAPPPPPASPPPPGNP